MMKKLLFIIIILALAITWIPQTANAAGGIFASGGGAKTVGQSFTISVVANGATFDSIQGKISVSGPVTIQSFSAGSATWLPGKSPSNNTEFVGITSSTSSLTVATIKLVGTSAGSGSVSISNAKLASNGSIVGSSSSNASFTIEKALTPPGSVSVSSSSHPNQDQSYEEKTIQLSWNKASGVTGFSYLLDQSSDTIPSQEVDSADTSATYENKEVGTYYFHIRAQNADGWSSATHFKVSIKEPDPKINEGLAAPTITTIEKGTGFTTDLTEGTVSNILLRGTGLAGYRMNFSFQPDFAYVASAEDLPVVDSQGNWELLVKGPIKSGFYALTAQGQQDKVLTPKSETAYIELSLSQGGNLQFITAEDDVTAAKDSEKPATNVAGANATSPQVLFTGAGVLLLAALLVVYFIKRKNLPK
jgi:hypothetical protein